MALTDPHCTKYDISGTIVGYRCPDEFEAARLSRVQRHVCIQYCVQKVQCHMISFNNKEQLCLIYNRLCVETKHDLRFSSLVLHEAPRRNCIFWVGYEGSVPLEKRIIYTEAGKYSLVRFHYNGEMLPGRLLYKTSTQKVKTVKHKNGLYKVNEDATNDVEFLFVSETCSVAWVPYTAGRKMPSGVVKGGWKWNEQPLFVAGLWTTADSETKYGFGHYDPQNEKGYVFNNGVASNKTMNLLVEI